MIYFLAYKGRLMNRFHCKVSYKEDPLVIMDPTLRGHRFEAICRHVPGFTNQILPILKQICSTLKINGMAFLNLKLKGVDSEALFQGDTALMRVWEKKLNIPPGESFVKIIEMHARVGGGLQADPRIFAKMIRAYYFYLAYFTSEHHHSKAYDQMLYMMHHRSHEGVGAVHRLAKSAAD